MILQLLFLRSSSRKFFSSLVEPALEGDDDEEEEYTDIQGDLIDPQGELSRNPRWSDLNCALETPVQPTQVYGVLDNNREHILYDNLHGHLPHRYHVNNPLPFTQKFFDSLFSNPEMHTEWLYPGFKWMWKIEMTKIFLCSL